MWLCRKVFSTLAFIVLGVCAYKYKDYSADINQLLKEIRQLRKDISSGHDEIDSPIAVDSVDTQSFFHHGSSSEDMDSDLDQTYIPNRDNSSDSEAESYITAAPGSQRPSKTADFLATSLDGSFNLSNTSQSEQQSPKGRQSKPSKDSTLVTTPFQSPYNLRTRTTPIHNNSILNTESVEDFLKDAHSYKIKPIASPDSSRQRSSRRQSKEKGMFSSDEDL